MYQSNLNFDFFRKQVTMQNTAIKYQHYARPGSGFRQLFKLLFLLSMLLSTGFDWSVAGTKNGVAVGDQAPNFSLPSADGSDVSLAEYLGKSSVVLYFYPRDNTPVCTKEACSFRDSYKAFTDMGAVVIGVSSDSEQSHQNFAERNNLPFKLLSDKHGQVRKLYGVSVTLGMVPGRVTYVIDKKGIVRLIFNSQLDAQKHVDEALKVLKELDKS